ncbi:hypothetical protein RFI_19052, partial [Reticulomyxa filosa]
IEEEQQRLKEWEYAKKVAQMRWEKRTRLREANKLANKKRQKTSEENEDDETGAGMDMDEENGEDNENGEGGNKKQKDAKKQKKETKGETNIKKIQTFLKKIKGFNEPGNLKNVQSIVKEMSTFKLDRYLKEIVRDLSTIPINNDSLEIEALVTLVSSFHQMYDKFGKKFKDAILDIFNPKSHKISSASSSEFIFNINKQT